MIYVIVHDGGCEGVSAPIMAFRERDYAIASAKMMSQSDGYLVFEVPEWPEEPKDRWFNLVPIWPMRGRGPDSDE